MEEKGQFPLIRIFHKQGRPLPESAVSSPNREIFIFFSSSSYDLLSSMYVSADGRAERLRLTSIDAASPLGLERGAGMGIGPGAQPPRCSALLRGRAGSRRAPAREMSSGSRSSAAQPSSCWPRKRADLSAVSPSLSSLFYLFISIFFIYIYILLVVFRHHLLLLFFRRRAENRKFQPNLKDNKKIPPSPHKTRDGRGGALGSGGAAFSSGRCSAGHRQRGARREE